MSVLAQPPVEPYLAHDFGVQEFADRRSAVCAEMRRRGLDALLVVGPENIYYLTGLNFQGYFSFTTLLVPRDGPLLLVAREMEHATIAVQAPSCTHVAYGDDAEPARALLRAVRDATGPGATVGVELQAMFFPPGVWDQVRAALPNRAWIDASGLVVQLRAVKSAAELSCIRRAARISDRAVQAGLAAVSSDSTEREVAAAVYAQLVRGGSEHPGFAPLIRSTDILTHEHVTWRDRPLRSGSALLVELSASVYRYHAPLTRMLPVDEVDSGTASAAEIACGALEATRAAMVPGATTGEVHEVWQGVVDDGLGHRRYRRHHCGYSVGIGFPPSWVGGAVEGIRRGGELRLREGMVFHVLSWLLGQRPGDFCVSDTVVVAADGGRFLTRSRRQPVTE
ncbi:MAG: Xaa-Pro peptidase family protein [Actinomycetota bacterium]|nr:Xaa-Pro peptidase family protein [Actinomycetota bacterium]